MQSTARGRLARQALLVSVLAMIVDVGVSLYQGCALNTWPQVVTMLVVIGADLWLAGPARLSGLVAVTHGLVRILSMVAVGPPAQGNTAGLMIAGYRAGAWQRGWSAWLSVIATMACVGLSRILVFGVGASWPLLILTMVENGLLPWLVGHYTTTRRDYLTELEQRAEQERRDAKEAVAKAVAEERGAIARDLHDVIAHHVSAINVHAGAARLIMAGDQHSAELGESVTAVESSARSAMVELRHLLDLLHGDRADGARQPGLDNIDELFDGVRAAGLHASLITTGRPRDLPESLDIALYRIAQEMLTNALRHGDGTSVAMHLDYGESSLVLSASNPMPSDARVSDGPHRGLAGIANRAGMFKGVASSGPAADGTWRTAVVFPL
ncbi:sensor histidine kinase [Kutzneria sp. CA-103260]|uniref:sensor histidine kinase n=1 Tax=Kutzneria sp. CA-103260 TaxID=2802641 RepID=UPI001BAA9A3D|nr:histidine kinase [Kutzneria sp. CA-103260]QUQ62453.1 two-component system histidine kinase [Kutzneria sp. CA-103260]